MKDSRPLAELTLLAPHSHCLHHFTGASRLFWCCNKECYNIFALSDPKFEIKEQRHGGNTLLLARPKALLVSHETEHHIRAEADHKHAVVDTVAGPRTHCYHRYLGHDRLYWCCGDGCYDIAVAKKGYKINEMKHHETLNTLFELQPKVLLFGPIKR